ncbi:hypothetical protein B0H13DRAFT_2026610 [Mycena leptocephala]|nr:hypothetical protein B0H13DRAFT_2026610 [Mycena leptocephala]
MAAEFGIAVGAFNVASFMLGSGPQAITYLTDQFKGTVHQPAAEDAVAILQILEKYDALLTEAEATEIMTIFWNIKWDLKSAESALKNRSAFQKLVGYSKTRKAAGKVIANSRNAKNRVINISEKARLRAIFSRRRDENTARGESSSATSSERQPLSPGSQLTASMISLPFRNDDTSVPTSRLPVPVAVVGANARVAVQSNEADPFQDGASVDITSMVRYPSMDSLSSISTRSLAD